jgi:hypothetical protein
MPSNPTIRILSRAPWCLGLALAAVASLPLTAQQTQPAQPQVLQPDPADKPAPKGQVLFERHETIPTDDTTPADAAIPAATPPAKPGVSSSQSQPHTLRRRLVPGTSAEATAEQPVQAPSEKPTEVVGVSSSQADDPTPILLITEADRTAAEKITNAERSSLAITGTRLDLHLDTHTGGAEVRAQLTLRNTGTEPLQHLPLRISGALHWESARINGATTTLAQYHLPDDLDHTGIATELAVALPQPLAPGASVSLDLFYGGTLTSSEQRLLNLGAPMERAIRTDWDTVSDTFTGLRGIGNVLWYPMAGLPAMLRDGAAVPLAVDEARTRNATTPFHLAITLQYTGTRPEAAFFCGERKLLKPIVATPNDTITNAEGGVVLAEWDRPTLGPHTPSLFVAQAAPQEVASGLLRVVTDRPDTAAALGEAAMKVKPMLAEWLGAAPSRPLDVVDLPIPGAAGFTDGSLLVAPLTTAPAAALAPSMVGPLTAAWLPADVSAPWLRDGLPAFMQAVWSERTEGRTAALNGLAATRIRLNQASAPAQPATSSSSSSDEPTQQATTSAPLATCADAACTRAKAAYVFEMLRGILGDTALQQALSGWRVAQETKPQRTAASETASLKSLLQQVAGKRDLGWFFQSWIDADHGLPELSIVTVAPRRVERYNPGVYLPPKDAVGGPLGPEPVPKPGDPESVAPQSITPGNKIAPAAGSWLVAVEVQNTGAADAEVPVTVRSGGLTNTLQLRVPAHSRATIRVPFEADPQEVLVNDGSVPEVRTSQHRRSIGSLSQQQ